MSTSLRPKLSFALLLFRMLCGRKASAQDRSHIHVTHQGIGLRSFLDYKIKGSFYVSGGYELNYRSAFKDIDALKDRSAWQKAA